MKLLLFSDVHCDKQKAMHLVQLSADVDVVVGAGDFANMRRGLDDTIGILKLIEQPTVLVCGNSESETELEEACAPWPTAHVLHGTAVEVDGLTFYGLGGAVPETPFGSWSYDLSEDRARELLAELPEEAVLVTHSPPHGILDESSSGKNIGSQAVREAIEQKQPMLVVCGHIHACSGQHAMLGNTMVVNAGPDGIELELPV